MNTWLKTENWIVKLIKLSHMLSLLQYRLFIFYIEEKYRIETHFYPSSTGKYKVYIKPGSCVEAAVLKDARHQAPWKESALKGSSVWKGSPGGSRGPLLLLNMAIRDLKESVCRLRIIVMNFFTKCKKKTLLMNINERKDTFQIPEWPEWSMIPISNRTLNGLKPTSLEHVYLAINMSKWK